MLEGRILPDSVDVSEGDEEKGVEGDSGHEVTLVLAVDSGKEDK
jgi:hypothetical protein